MKKFAIVVLILGGLGFGWLLVLSSRYEPKTRPGLSFEGIDVGGLTRAEATGRIFDWWKTQRDTTVKFTHPGMKTIERPLTMCGVILDQDKSLNQLPFDSFWASLTRSLAKPEPTEFKAVYARIGPRNWGDVVKALKGVPGAQGVTPDQRKLTDMAYEAALKRGSVEVPVMPAPKAPAEKQDEEATPAGESS